MIRVLGPLIGVVLLISCAKGAATGPDALEISLKSAEQEADGATDREALGRAIALYLEVLALDPENIEGMAGLARTYSLRGYGWTDTGDYRVARELGFKCLLLERGFSARVSSAGGMLTADALMRIDARGGQCLYWAGWAWLRWVVERSPEAMVMDHAILVDIGSRSVELAQEETRGEALALLGLALALDPGHSDEAAEAFGKAIRLQPDHLSIQVDFAQWVLIPQGSLEQARKLLGRIKTAPIGTGAHALENKRAASRAAQLLLDMSLAEGASAPASGED